MITVTGATGRLGGHFVGNCWRRFPRARSPSSSGVPTAPPTRRGGAPTPPPAPDHAQHAHVIGAAVDAGAGRIVYTSAIGAEDGPGFLADHTATQKLLRATGLPVTLLRTPST